MVIPNIIFDLDGTLVDSSSGILSSLSAAFETCGISPCQQLTTDLIGPPLAETICRLVPGADDTTIESLIAHFKENYDTTGFRDTIPYSGVHDMLEGLLSKNAKLYIATNKRMIPTIKILAALQWSGLFNLVLSPDSFSPSLSTKSNILSKLLITKNLSTQECIYVGDRLDDYNAAKEVGIQFALAEWGFEGDDTRFPSDAFRIKTPDANVIQTHLDMVV